MVGRGFGDALRIGNQARPRLFDLNVRLPALLHERAVEVGGRVGIDGAEIEELDEAGARAAFQAAVADGIRACAIVLMHAWKYPAHEQRLAALAREAGFSQVSASHATSPLLRLVPRGDTTVVDAYLSPILRRYVEQVAGELPGVKLYFMQSNGGLADAAAFGGKDAILSGPAGGIVGAARTAESAGVGSIIGFDMGGTSTDVALYDGAFERTFETAVAGVRIRAPMMAINTVAAGGGSVLQFDGGRYQVGPASAGAVPGPACYRRGGPLTVTDANVMVGKIQPEHFPAIFGPNGDQTLDAEIVREKFAALTPGQDGRAAAEGFLRIAVANMANAIKQVSLQKGHDAARFALHCFGGAGGQHACLVADELGMTTVFIHPFAGVLSAYGMGLADQAVLREQAVEAELTDDLSALQELAGALAADATAALAAQGADPAAVRVEQRLHLRYAGTQAALEVALTAGGAGGVRHGPSRAVRVCDAGAGAGGGSGGGGSGGAGRAGERAGVGCRDGGGPEAVAIVALWSGGAEHQAPVFERTALLAGDRLAGPALIREANATTVVEPGWTAEVTGLNHLVLRSSPHRAASRASAPHPGPLPEGEGQQQARERGRAWIRCCWSCSTTCSPTWRSRPAWCWPTRRCR